MKLPQQVGSMPGYVTAAMPFMPLGGVTASPLIGWQRQPPPPQPPPRPPRPAPPLCNCVQNGNFLVPGPGSCLTSYTQCYNDGTCACVNAPPPNGGAQFNQQHVYNALNAIGF
jgi:hypothetical protein